MGRQELGALYEAMLQHFEVSLSGPRPKIDTAWHAPRWLSHVTISVVNSKKVDYLKILWFGPQIDLKMLMKEPTQQPFCAWELNHPNLWLFTPKNSYCKLKLPLFS